MKEIIRKIIMVISVIVFLYSAYNLIDIYIGYEEISNEQEELVQEFVKPIENTENKENKEDKEEKKEEKEKLPAIVVEDPYSRSIAFNNLLKVNDDVIGWIYIPGTRVDEPILKGENNDTYLRTSIYNKYLLAGSIFIDEDNSEDFNDMKTIIYGHNMTNGTRFGQLSKFLKKDFFDKHPCIYIYKPDGTMYIYDIFVARVIEASSPLYYQVDDYQDFVSQIQDGAEQVRHVSDKESPIVYLSTCVNSDLSKRYVIAGRLKNVVRP